MASLKGPGAAQAHDGSALRIAIVHARWNTSIIDPLVAGAKKSLTAAGVKDENIIIQSVPGSYELPFAVQRIYAASQIQSSTTSTVSATDLLSSIPSLTDLPSSSSLLSQSSTPSAPPPSHPPPSSSTTPSTSPFDAIIAIGVLIKGETMHFEYIAEATSHGLMRVQLDCGVPVVFGLLTVLDEGQARARAGVGDEGAKGHNHGEDWGSAAVELGVKRRTWGEGKMV
ncbi:MAG: hypothetical protein M1830_009620 [Pleopsidium flavum]|nr:MAG: hypothetical protein M1830_009620 [Pleopsidium flavum]